MPDKLTELLAKRDWLLADGATGTTLFAMGLEAGEAPELWNVDAPDNIRALYQGSVDAGCDIFLTNTFGGTGARLKLHNAQDRVRELNMAGARIAREVADAAGRPVIVAGSVGPTGEILEPVGSLSHDDAVALFEEQARALIEGGVDVLWLETISAPEELRAAAEAFANIGAPWTVTMSFDTAGRTMMGVTPAALVALAESLPNPPIAFGANCGVGASDLVRTVMGFAEAAPHTPMIAKANAGIPKYVEGSIEYDGTPELMADYAVIARDTGARIIGGCCGTRPVHLRQMRAALETRPRGPAPDLETVAQRLGDFSSPGDGTGADGPKRERRSRRK